MPVLWAWLVLAQLVLLPSFLKPLCHQFIQSVNPNFRVMLCSVLGRLACFYYTHGNCTLPWFPQMPKMVSVLLLGQLAELCCVYVKMLVVADSLSLWLLNQARWYPLEPRGTIVILLFVLSAFPVYFWEKPANCPVAAGCGLEWNGVTISGHGPLNHEAWFLSELPAPALSGDRLHIVSSSFF